MKKVLLITFIGIFCCVFLIGQNQVTLNINHKLGVESVEPGRVGQNNLNHSFTLSRLQYYISEIEIIHDGGQIRTLRELWILVDALEATSVNLGMLEVEHVESIKFSIGVDPEHNHLDPSSYQTGHPLAPIFPSMHWGWAAGYRFVAMEGNCGNALNLVFQLHALGDNNYFSNEVEVSKSAVNGILDINLDADYTRALEDINMQSGVIVHGDNLEAQKMLHNFRDHVFTAETLTSTDDVFLDSASISVYPNPSQKGIVSVSIETSNSDQLDIQVFDLNGRLVKQQYQINSGFQMDCSDLMSGMYMINVLKEGKISGSKKLIIE